MRRTIALFLALLMLFALSACGARKGQDNAPPPAVEEDAESAHEDEAPAQQAYDPSFFKLNIEGELVVFADSSLTDCLNQVKDSYEKANPALHITCMYDSSSALRERIEQGEVCDLFISASVEEMNAIDYSANHPNYLQEGSRIELLENTATGQIYPAAVPKASDNMVIALAFLEELAHGSGAAVFADAGFRTLD